MTARQEGKYDMITWANLCDSVADRLDHPGTLVPEHYRKKNATVADGDICTTHAGPDYSDQDLILARFFELELFNGEGE